MVLKCGIDEAGRGPIIGPMVICGVLIAEEDEQKLVDLGVKDSKLMTPLQRERAFDIIIKTVISHHAIIVPPAEIDAAVDAKDDNLNFLEARKSAEIIRKLEPERTVLDCPSPNVMAYRAYVVSKVGKEVDLLCTHHADRDHVTVGAASIIAKVIRDGEIEKIKEKVGDFGSGYVADPNTKVFIEKHWKEHPEIFRKSWKPYKNLVKEAAQTKL